MQSQEDSNIMNAWQNGGLYQGKPATDQVLLAYWDNRMSKLDKGDEVVTTGGILGRISEVNDTFVTLEIADGVRIKVQKAQITQLMPKGTLKSA